MMRLSALAVIVLAFGCRASAQDRPLPSLPYTPSLETKFIDRAADPCVDFYRFACGNWNSLNPIPPDQARWNVYAKLGQENMQYLWGILADLSHSSATRTPSEQKIGDYFAACMDEAAIAKAGATPLKKDLDAIDGLTRLAGLPALLARLHLQAGDRAPLFGFGSEQDFADSSKMIPVAAAGGLGLPDRDYYTKTDPKSVEIRAKYVEHVARLLSLLGESPDAAKRDAQTVMDIETALAKASLTRVDRRDPYKIYHKMTRAELSALTPSFGWTEYWKAIGLAAPASLNITEPDFFKDLERQLKTRSIADWRAYLRWHLAHGKAPYLSSDFAQADFDFFRHYLNGVAQMPPRWKRCVRWVDRDLGEALGQVFVSKTFTPDTKDRAASMTREIEKAMEADLRQITWMSAATKQRALEKLHGMVNKIGYPNRWRDYGPLQITGAGFLENVDRAAMFENRRELNKIGKPVDRQEWDMTPPTVNAYYNPQMNDINFPAGVLQPPLFDPKLDDAPNFGNTGATIGHELTHGFDDEGRQFDAKGNLKDWWTKEDAAEFIKRATCVSDQYSQYTVIDDIKINGKLTLGEDVADLGGTLLAYVAWKEATKGQDLKPVDGFTADQRFFIGMAQWACGFERPESKRANAITNPHSPEEYRINGVVSNMPEFAKAFSCKAGQPMVRKNACRVW
jgi:putative endopeptidase